MLRAAVGPSLNLRSRKRRRSICVATAVLVLLALLGRGAFLLSSPLTRGNPVEKAKPMGPRLPPWPLHAPGHLVLAIPSADAPVPVGHLTVTHPVPGIKRVLTTVQQRVRTHREREEPMYELVGKLFKQKASQKPLFLDIGSNQGCYALYAAALGAISLAVEPQGLESSLIALSVAHNGLDVEVIRAAILDVIRPEGVILRDRGSNGPAVDMSGKKYHVHDEGMEEEIERVPVISIDALLSRNESVFLMMIDVEGAEVSALRSAKKALKEGRVQSLVVEYGPPQRWLEFDESSREDGLGELEQVASWGYDIWVLSSDCYQPFIREIGRPGVEILGAGVEGYRTRDEEERRLVVDVMERNSVECYLWLTRLRSV